MRTWFYFNVIDYFGFESTYKVRGCNSVIEAGEKLYESLLYEPKDIIYLGNSCHNIEFWDE